MKIETTLDELEETIYKYNELLGWADSVEIQDSEEIRLGITCYRIQFPTLSLALRPGVIMSRHGGEHYEYHNPNSGEHAVINTPPPEDAEWEIDASLTVIYALEEEDINQYEGWSSDGYQGTLYDYLYPTYKDYSDLNDIPCFIDTTDFMKDEAEAEKYARESLEHYDGDE